MAILRAVNLTKVYGGTRGTAATRALDSFDITVEAGEFTAIMGPSGSGKTTLLNLLGTIDRPTAGDLLVDGVSLAGLKGNDLADFRRRRLGFIFQDFNLLDSLTLRENIMIPLVLENRSVTEMDRCVAALSRRLGIEDVLDHHPYEVSGGQKQRAAAARALIHAPALVLADEPTGNLDSSSARALMQSLAELNEADGTTILLVTHDPVCASYCRRVLLVKDGKPYTELRRGEGRTAFFHQILDVLSAMGGEQYDAVYPRR